MSSMTIYENPYDLESFMEGLEIAKETNKQMLYMDRVFTYIRIDSNQDLTGVVYKALNELNLIELEPTN